MGGDAVLAQVRVVTGLAVLKPGFQGGQDLVDDLDRFLVAGFDRHVHLAVLRVSLGAGGVVLELHPLFFQAALEEARKLFVHDREEAIEAYSARPFDVVLMDVRMPVRDGLDATREITGKHKDTKVIMLTTFADDELLFDAISAGASGYVLKQIRGSDLVTAVRSVASGQSMLDPATTVSGIQIVSHLVPTPSVELDPDAACIESYRELLGDDPMVSHHATWVAIRLDVADAYTDWASEYPNDLRLGAIFVFDVDDTMTVAAVVAQRGYGPSSRGPRIRYEALRQALDGVAATGGAGRTMAGMDLIAHMKLLDMRLSLHGQDPRSKSDAPIVVTDQIQLTAFVRAVEKVLGPKVLKSKKALIKVAFAEEMESAAKTAALIKGGKGAKLLG